MTEYLEPDLALLAGATLRQPEIDLIQRLLQEPTRWLQISEAHLAHGDFDITPILQVDGHYSGIIDFSEVRGASRVYDLGHFHLHDGQHLPMPGFRWIAEGYARGAELPADAVRRAAFEGLLIGIRRLARSLRVRPEAISYQRLLAGAIRRELALLG